MPRDTSIKKQAKSLTEFSAGVDVFSLGKKSMFKEVGQPGLRMYSGFLEEEFLPELRGFRAARIYQEMRDNDPTVGAMLYVMEQLIQNATLSVSTNDSSQEGLKAQALIESAINDMYEPWQHVLSEILTFMPFGYAPMEVTFKYRRGYNQDPTKNSKHNDGKIGWHKIALRGQDSTYRWHVNENMEVMALEQDPPPTFKNIVIKENKLLLFRHRAYKSNPEGRALDPSTEIPTPSGWKTLGELKTGDKVFDENGRIRYVTATAYWKDRPCYELVFSDNTKIVADENHEWLTETLNERSTNKLGKRRTTKEIYETVKSYNGVSNHGIKFSGPLDYPEQNLILHPYYLGLWLGDGTSATSDISCHVEDAEETVELLASCGYVADVVQNGLEDCNGRLIRVKSCEGSWASSNPANKLNILNLKNNKHIPNGYLVSSIEQRIDLLCGLMDSDGTVDKDGRCEFVNTNIDLVNGVAELVRSLGISARIGLRKRANGTSHKKDAYCVRFTPDFAPFKLSRKLERIKPTVSRKYHYIKSCIRVENRDTVCIEVDGLSHLFLAGRGLIPTSNSLLRNAYRPWYYKKRIEDIEAIAIERELNGLPVLTPPEGYNLWNPNDPIAAEALRRAEELVMNIRADRHHGVVLPFGWTLVLLSSTGQRSHNTSEIITRYDQRIATTVLADMLLIGQERVGSFALVSAKVSLFSKALRSIAIMIEEEFNRKAIPRLLRANGYRLEKTPYLTFGPIDTPDLKSIAEYLNKLVGNRILTPEQNLERHVRQIAGFPAKLPEDQILPSYKDVKNPVDDDQSGQQETEGARAFPGEDAFSDAPENKPASGGSSDNVRAFPPEGGEKA